MQDWEKALDTFLKSWHDHQEVVGALVCGSYVVGSPTPHSDIDVHIVLREGTPWRERGNQIVDGFLIEYFANPPQQIIEYFKEDYADHSQMAVIQFLTGRILFDDGTIQALKAEAQGWYDKKFPEQPPIVQELNKYSLWDRLDNLQDTADQDAPHFWFAYHNLLNELLRQYCRFTGYPEIKSYQALDILTKQMTRDKYLLPVFPDENFQGMMEQALVESDQAEALRLYERLTQHVLERMSGFEIDGWKVRSPVSY
jgi:hypothetical protein